MTKEIKAGMALGAALFEYKDARFWGLQYGEMDMECWSEDSNRKRLAAKLCVARKAVREWIPKPMRICENCAYCRRDESYVGWHCLKKMDMGNLFADETSCACWEPNTQKGGEQ